jgi:hypothetical protein
MVAVRQLSGLCTTVFGPRSKVSRGLFPELSSRTFSSSFITPEKNCSYRRLIVTVQFQMSQSIVLNVLPESYLAL